jgi:hypothetical protein
MPKRYQITPRLWLVRDEDGVRFHIQSDDYFGTMATILSLLEEQIKKDGVKNSPVWRRTLKNLQTDLLFLQKNYVIGARRLTAAKTHIKPQSQKKIKTPLGKLNNQ